MKLLDSLQIKKINYQTKTDTVSLTDNHNNTEEETITFLTDG